MKNAIEKITCKQGLGMNVEKLAGIVYFELRANGVAACILNDRYIVIGDERFQFIKARSKGQWIVRNY